ncbi:MAG TPA: hypothetical protein GX715_20070 [Armatimonadetes bacterium]|nr:hypothetical protein [Armatimonadota bacterium]
MSDHWDLLGLGAVAVDDLLYVEHYPQPETKTPVQGRRREGGGLAGTALAASARQGAKAAYFGILGDDELSHFTLREFERDGVDCSMVIRRAGARPIHSTVIIEASTGQRTILFTRAGFTTPQPDEVPAALISRCRVLFLDHTVAEAGVRAASIAHEYGIPVLADLERDTGPKLAELLPLIDHLVLGIRFGSRLTGEEDPVAITRALAGPSRASCVVTAGERGCWYSVAGGEVRHLPAFPVRVADTNGCGDVFHGVYAAQLAQGASIDAAVRFASAAAAIKATRPGGRSGIPQHGEVERFLAERR